jgi:hypothetical protein
MENFLENALTEDEKYVRECEQLVREQAAVVDRLDRKAAEDAMEILVALKKELDLARSHLRIDQAVYDAPLV